MVIARLFGRASHRKSALADLRSSGPIEQSVAIQSDRKTL
jgi:hypothetical protein